MMNQSLTLLAICGSLRQGSYNRSLLRYAEQAIPDGVRLKRFDLAPVPLYNEDLRAQGMPSSVEELRQQIRQVDGLLIATPEYNYSIPGVLKNAIDWVSRPPDQPLSAKPIALMGSGGGFGTWTAQLQLRHVLSALNGYVLNRPLVTIGNVWDKVSPEGQLIDPPSCELIRQMLIDFTAWIRLLQTNRA